MNCSRIRTAKFSSGYEKPQSLRRKFFVLDYEHVYGRQEQDDHEIYGPQQAEIITGYLGK